MSTSSHRYLVDLAERKLGKGATVRHNGEGWTAERNTNGNRSRVTASDRSTLEWFLEQMPDKRE